MPVDELVEVMKARGRSLQRDEVKSQEAERGLNKKLKKGTKGVVRKF